MPDSVVPESFSPAPLRIVARASGRGRAFELSDGVRTRRYRLSDHSQDSYLDFFCDAARDFGLRRPHNRTPFEPPPAQVVLTPLLTWPVAPSILYGYGDPCVIRAPDPDGRPAWRLTVTSNDAPDAFPILKSDDITHWSLEGFVFPRGQAPPWCLTGENQADFWAPEIHRVGEEYWVCFAARRHDRELAIGLARGPSPAGPFTPDPEPLLGDEVIDPHLFITGDGLRLLFWKEDTNGVWPRRLAALLAADPGLADVLFDAEIDRRTAAFSGAIWPWAGRQEPMEQFFILQPLIEAVAQDCPAFAARLQALKRSRPDQAKGLDGVIATFKTRIFAQALSADGRRLEGDPLVVLENDQAWEAHLIEGVWVTEHAGRFYMFYSGNDFSTPHYAIGAAMAAHPLGPYVKTGPLLGSSRDWVGPGHPSVAPGPDGAPWLFLHAFPPGRVGYKAFRALLAAKLTFGPDGPSLA